MRGKRSTTKRRMKKGRMKERMKKKHYWVDDLKLHGKIKKRLHLIKTMVYFVANMVNPLIPNSILNNEITIKVLVYNDEINSHEVV